MKSELEPEVIEEIQNGRKINAIKKLRELRRIDLKEAKELVDAYSPEKENFTPSVQKANSGNGLIILVVICAAAFFLYKYFN